MLIKCSECSKEISDKATACHHCGCPITKIEKQELDWSKLVTCPICGKGVPKSEYCINCNNSLCYVPKKESYDDSIKCPTCHSTKVSAIGGVERGISVVALGIFSKKINKSFKCKKCGYTW